MTLLLLRDQIETKNPSFPILHLIRAQINLNLNRQQTPFSYLNSILPSLRLTLDQTFKQKCKLSSRQ